MQDSPSSTVLIEAIQELLLKQVMPAVSDDDMLAYKTLVSWNMLGVVAREIKMGDDQLKSEIERLCKILGERVQPGTSYQEKCAIVGQLNSRLVQKIRENKLSSPDDDAWHAIKKTVIEKLEVLNPRFSVEPMRTSKKN